MSDELELQDEVVSQGRPVYRADQLHNMIAENAKLCMAAGINPRNFDPIELYQTAGKIISDTYLRTRMIAEKTDRVGALEQMAERERMELRERVTGVLKFSVKK